jgi:N-acyl-L-homoserine lactone synthetase
MAARIKVATTPAEIDGVFRLRHKVFVEEEGYMEGRPDRRILDRFDAFPTTGNVIAVVEGRVVGSMRITEDSEAGTSADTFFDFRPHLPPSAGKVGAASQICVERECRKTPGLTFTLMGMAYYLARSRGLSHLKAVANPDVQPMFLGTGWKAVAPQFFHEGYRLRCIPMLLDLENLSDRFLSFVRQQSTEHVLQTFQRQFHSAGETILRAGDEGQEVFIIIDGSVTVCHSDKDGAASARKIKELGPGDMFGEMAVLASSRATADVTAVTDVNLMVLERGAFEDQLLHNPAGTVQLLRLLGSRLADGIT